MDDDIFTDSLNFLSSLPFDQFSYRNPEQRAPRNLPNLFSKSDVSSYFAHIPLSSPLPHSELMALINPDLTSIPPSTSREFDIESQVEKQPDTTTTNSGSRSLLQDDSVQRVTDMAFFAKDVHRLASASIDGRALVWNIDEGPDEEDNPQITGNIIMALQIEGDKESVVSPQVCWHPDDQGVLVVGIGIHVLKIDVSGLQFSGEEPHKCDTGNLINGVRIVGKHSKEVTDLSMCKSLDTTRLVSASKDGQVKIWAENMLSPLAVFNPHTGQPVNSVTFLTFPRHSGVIVLTTSGSLNQEIMIWSKQPHQQYDTESWNCTQALELKSSAETPVEQAFFSQVIALPFAESPVKDARFILIANAKENAIYVVHIGYDESPSATRLDYVTEFTVKMPILSGTSVSLPDKDNLVKLYCVQDQIIQHYSLDFYECLPPPKEHNSPMDTDSSLSDSDDSSTKPRDALHSSQSNSSKSYIKAESGSSAHSSEAVQKSLDQMMVMLNDMHNQREEDLSQAKNFESTLNRMEETVQNIQKIVQDTVLKALGPILEEVNAKVDRMAAKVDRMADCVNELITSAGASSKADEMISVLKDELLNLIRNGKFEEAFKAALRNRDDAIVSWLCDQVDFKDILDPPCLSQGLLLHLLHWLAFDIDKETTQKLAWITQLALFINPTDPLLVRPATLMLREVFQRLKEHETLITTTDRSIQPVLARINSVLESCAKEPAINTRIPM